MAQDYPLEQFKTVIIFSVTKYIPLILMVNLTPGILYHGNKNCDIDKNNIAKLSANIYIVRWCN